MLFLLGGVAVLGGLLLLAYLFVNADPARLARNLKYTGVAIAAVALLALFLLPPAREIAIMLFPLALSMPLLSRVRSLLDRLRPPSGGQSSAVETEFLRMMLDHDTGDITGAVRRGRFAGLRVEELDLPDLLALLRECRAEDDRGAQLLEAYLDRVHADWREHLRGEREGARQGGAGSGTGDMSVEEAHAILGLAPGAGAEEIKEAHRRLMIRLHPDHGGSDYLASQLNRARDLLLRR